MRIGLFVCEAGRMAGGPETYEVELVRALADLDRQNEYVVYCTHAGAVDAIGLKQDNVSYRVLHPASRWISLPVTLPALLLKDGVDFFHSTMVPPPLSPKRYCLSILCFSNWAHPEFYPKDVVRRLNFLLDIGVRKAKYLLCNSRNLLEYIGEAFHVPEERMTVTHLGVGPEFHPLDAAAAREEMRSRYNLREPYVLFVGKHQERKNVFRVIEAYARFRRDAPSDARLLLVGREPSLSDEIQAHIERCGVAPHVDRVRYIPHHDLPALYRAADMFVFPSLWEGFGLPVIESMACGTPVVTSNVTSLPEIAGDGALIVDPQSSDAIADAMVRIQRDGTLRGQLVQRGLDRASQFTWKRCAQQTLDVYQRMALA